MIPKLSRTSARPGVRCSISTTALTDQPCHELTGCFSLQLRLRLELVPISLILPSLVCVHNKIKAGCVISNVAAVLKLENKQDC